MKGKELVWRIGLDDNNWGVAENGLAVVYSAELAAAHHAPAQLR